MASLAEAALGSLITAPAGGSSDQLITGRATCTTSSLQVGSTNLDEFETSSSVHAESETLDWARNGFHNSLVGKYHWSFTMTTNAGLNSSLAQHKMLQFASAARDAAAPVGAGWGLIEEHGDHTSSEPHETKPPIRTRRTLHRPRASRRSLKWSAMHRPCHHMSPHWPCVRLKPPIRTRRTPHLD